jgi:hypothetical protein
MNKVERSELLGLGEYEQIREQFRARVIADKRSRRLQVADDISVIFENHDTVLFQIQEMLRTERITKEASVQHELDTYNELIPARGELSATMFVEIPDRVLRDGRLSELVGLEGRIALEIDGVEIRARNETRGVIPDRTTAVHYIKFPLGTELGRKLVEAARAGREGTVCFKLDHPRLQVKKALPLAAVKSLAEDLEPMS